jgi:hypothetical protein
MLVAYVSSPFAQLAEENKVRKPRNADTKLLSIHYRVVHRSGGHRAVTIRASL